MDVQGALIKVVSGVLQDVLDVLKRLQEFTEVFTDRAVACPIHLPLPLTGP